ncbi:inner centromere protein A [Pleuronectes platessa]|uniref:inner centromere protein A n=1 Tax=Pleuronectes platessa TaxID=8262 RepID=UPI00232A55EF|nr:inner centromere protein A [Pleuronectes platessa]
MDASPEDNTSAIPVVSKYAVEATTMKAKQISDGQDGHITKTENRRISSRRSGKKAARIARARDHFAQRGKGGSDTERDETPPEAKQAAREEKLVEKPSDVPSLSEGGNGSELSQVVSEALDTRSKSLTDVLHDTTLANDSTSNSEPEKSESKHLTDSATLTGGGSATDTSDEPLHSQDESAPAKSICRAEGETQEQHTGYETTNNSAVDSVTSVETSEGLVGQNTSFTFGTVVAPLYQHMFYRVGCESEYLGERGNPIQATLSFGESTHSNPHSEGKESCCTLLSDLRNNTDTFQGNVINTQESNQENLDATSNNPPNEEEQMHLYETAGDIQDSVETLQNQSEVLHLNQVCPNISNVPKTLSGAEVNILHTDLLSTQVPTESFHRQGEAQEDSLSCDFQNQRAKAAALQAQPPENTSSQTIFNRDTNEVEDVTASVENLLLRLQPDGDETFQQTSKGGENEKDCKHKPVSTTNASAELENLGEPDEGLTPNTIHHSAARETENIYMSNGEDAEGNYSSTSRSSQETETEIQTKTRNGNEQNKLTNNQIEDEKEHSGETEVNDEEDESMTQASDNHTCGNDTFMESKEEKLFKDEPMSAALLREDLADTTEENNWEMMVEEDEKIILADQEENKATCLKADTETEQTGRSEDTGIETELEDTNSAEREKDLSEELRGNPGENGTEAEDAEGLEDKENDGEEIWKVGELENVQSKNTEKKEAEEEHRDGDIEMEKGEEQEETELDKEQHFAEMQEVSIGRIDVREVEEIEGEEEMQTDLNNGYDNGVVWDDQVKPREENAEEEIPNYEGEIALDGARDSEVVDLDSGSMTAEDGEDEVSCCEEMSDVQQIKEEGLSAQMNHVQACNKDREEGSAHFPAEMYFYKDEDFQGAENDPNNRSEAECLTLAMEGDSCILADEPGSDQTGQDSAESDSDDEVELYMHCLRAVHTGAQANKDKNKDTGFTMGKRPSVNRGKLLSTPMPSITESLDEEPHLSCHQDIHKDTDAADVQPAAAASSLLGGQDTVNRNVSCWKEAFSCRNLSRTLLCITLLVLFFVVAYHYDFLACFGLYLISVVWLCFQGERQPAKNNKRIG